MDWVYDFSESRPSQQALKDAGTVAVCRYVKRLLPNKYDIDRDEREQYLSWGLAVLYNAEQDNDSHLTQDRAYFADFGKYVGDRLQSIGVPTTANINVALSADKEIIGSDVMAAVVNKFAAFADAVKPFGMIAYGQTGLIDLLVSEGISPAGAKHWLTGSCSWSGFDNTPAGWNSYRSYPHAGLVQFGPEAEKFYWNGSGFSENGGGGPSVADATVDVDLIVDITSMGFEFPPGHPYAPKDDDEMTVYHAEDGQGGTWYVAGDFQSKVRIVSGTARFGGVPGGGAAGLIARGVVKTLTPEEMPPEQLAAIPDVTVRP